MSILSLILALALEQLRPISNRNPIYLMFVRIANNMARSLNAGEYRNGVYAWILAVVPLLVGAVGGYWAFTSLSVFAALAWNVAVLYLLMGFRQFSYAFTGISKALQRDDLSSARELLGGWTGQSTSELRDNEVARLTIEQGVIDSHRYVFGTIFWFVVLAPFAGPAGAVLYRAASLLQQKWGGHGDVFGRFADSAMDVLDFVPVRLAAVSFAIVGNFEDAVYCWREQAAQWMDQDYGILLASAAGALGIRLGEALHQDHTVKFRPELGVGSEASTEDLVSAVALVWRAAILWLAVILLFSIAQWLS
ncbi:CobD/CbiB family protein [Chitinibacter bivalviorum]|uniref:Cobalamin biosynthesis protein CobD n=1 Tax=Chitinibacter bivalviorum TaxID=2739434 RepID=A0A7H9BJK1_9NEIS|nr:CobD/CbiB family protein [Chitinibacter bivalviorum]QLG88191.1 CobD/CbiB family protein [Chitinibacter bivalviorum]